MYWEKWEANFGGEDSSKFEKKTNDPLLQLGERNNTITPLNQHNVI